jgi:hypothetical protein
VPLITNETRYVLKKSLPAIFLALLLACGLLVASCGGQTQTSNAGTPKQAVIDFLSALKRNDYNAMYDMLTSQDQKQVSRKDWVDINSKAPASMAEGNKQLAWTVTGEDVKGNDATVTVKLTQGGQSEDDTIGLVKEGKDWKVSLSSPGNGTNPGGSTP